MREGKIERMIEEALKPLQSKLDKQQSEIIGLKAQVKSLQRCNSELNTRTMGSIVVGA